VLPISATMQISLNVLQLLQHKIWYLQHGKILLRGTMRYSFPEEQFFEDSTRSLALVLNGIEVMYISNMLDNMNNVERSERELITRIR